MLVRQIHCTQEYLESFLENLFVEIVHAEPRGMGNDTEISMLPIKNVFKKWWSINNVYEGFFNVTHRVKTK